MKWQPTRCIFLLALLVLAETVFSRETDEDERSAARERRETPNRKTIVHDESDPIFETNKKYFQRSLFATSTMATRRSDLGVNNKEEGEQQIDDSATIGTRQKRRLVTNKNDLSGRLENDDRSTASSGRRLNDDGGNTTPKECLPPAIQYIVTCQDDSETECVEQLEQTGVDIIHLIHGTIYFAVCVDEDDIPTLRDLTMVQDMEEDPMRWFKEMKDERGSHRHLEQRIPYGIELVRATEFWATYGRRGEGVRVCVVDTGLDANHRDLLATSKDGSNDGDLVIPWFEDGDGHGTHVAGIVAAADNDLDSVGVAPNVHLYIARVFDNDGLFTASSLIDAMNECVLGGSNIISMSLGGPFASRAERRAIEQLTRNGVLLVAAAGNSGNSENPLEFPAGYDDVMSVAAIDEDSDIATFSTHNAAVDIAAPGVDVQSLLTGGTTTFKSGTSMACPHVAGVAALLMSQFPNEPTARIRQAMEDTSVDLGPCGRDNLFGYGRVDVMAAASYLENGATGRATIPTGCVEATVNTRTDDFGDETMWFILQKPSISAQPTAIVFRGGPYPTGVRETYTETFSLSAGGCYVFVVTDRQEDGTCCEYGQGSHEFIYNGEQLLFEDNFQGGDMSITFGCQQAICGDGIVQPGEECDDGNTNNADSCSNSCLRAWCGDGIIQTGEECDNGSNNSDQGACTNACQNARCGDGFVQPGEECDEGSNNSNEGNCTLECSLGGCVDGFDQFGAECNSTNATSFQDSDEFCENGLRRADSVGMLVLYFLGVFYMFVALALVCDQLFVPALEEMASPRHLNLSMDVAGATLMAAGGSAPELFTSIFGTFVHNSEVGIGTVVGSAVFNVLFVIAMCALFTNEVLTLTWWPLFRDCVCYSIGLVALGVFVGVTSPNEIELWEALILFGLYIGYVIVMYFNRSLHKAITGRDLEIRPRKDDNEFKSVLTMKMEDEEGSSSMPFRHQPEGEEVIWDSLKPPSRGDGCIAYTRYILELPLVFALGLTVPDVRRSGYHKYCYISFVLSIGWIGIFSYWMVDWAEVIGMTLGIPSIIMGLTLLAAVTSVPDLISSVIVAKQGEGDMAVSSSIGSNIFDILVGLPLPWTFYTAIHSDFIQIGSDFVWIHIFTLLGMLVFVVTTIHCQGWKLTRTLAVLMLLFYFGFLSLAVWLEVPFGLC